MADLNPNLPGIVLGVLEYTLKKKVVRQSAMVTHACMIRVTDGICTDPHVASHIVIGAPYSANKVREICRDTIQPIVRDILDTKVEGTGADDEFVICMMLDKIPYITVLIDKGTWKDENNHIPLKDDVRQAIAQKTSTRIPVMFINSNIPLSVLVNVAL